MLIYLNEAYERRVREGRMTTIHDLREAIIEGAVQRVRPKMMTVAAIMGGLLPIMWTTGTDDRWHGLVNHSHVSRHSGTLCLVARPVEMRTL